MWITLHFLWAVGVEGVLKSPSFYRGANWGTEKLSNKPGVTQLVSSIVGIWIQNMWLPSQCTKPLSWPNISHTLVGKFVGGGYLKISNPLVHPRRESLHQDCLHWAERARSSATRLSLPTDSHPGPISVFLPGALSHSKREIFVSIKFKKKWGMEQNTIVFLDGWV